MEIPLLDILIPTYNRAYYLKKNIDTLLGIIQELDLENSVRLIVSNNCSTDETQKVLSEFNHCLGMDLYEQEVNIGLERNSIFCLEKATSPYVMYMGDDDYISKEYLAGVIDYLKQNFYCIVPSIQAMDISGKMLGRGVGRDLGLLTTVYEPGLDGALALFEKGHQLSGLTFFRSGVLEEYLSRDIRDIHPFMFFVGFSCLRGKSVHFTQFPVKVTQPPQSNKDWDYRQDGLIIARLKSTFGVFKDSPTYLKKAQRIILWIDRGYGYRFLKSENGGLFKFFGIILSSKYLSPLNKIYFVYVETAVIIKLFLTSVLNK